MFYYCQNLSFIIFYNFYETNITLFDNFIYGTNGGLSLCFNIKNNSRINQELKAKFIEECLNYEIIQTTEEIYLPNTEFIKDSTENKNFIPTTIYSPDLSPSTIIITSSTSKVTVTERPKSLEILAHRHNFYKLQ